MTRQEATEFYRSHSKAVYNTALRIVRDPEEAEEIMQDTFMKYFTKGVPGLSEARKAAWLRTTCIRMGIDFLRRRKKGLELFVERIPDEAEEEEELPESIDVMRIRTAMERLPHPYSLILDLILIVCSLNGHSQQTINLIRAIKCNFHRLLYLIIYTIEFLRCKSTHKNRKRLRIFIN